MLRACSLNICSHVFATVDRLKPSLIVPYLGPFEVLSRTDKHFTIKRIDRTTTISIDRLFCRPTPIRQKIVSQCRKGTVQLCSLLDCARSRLDSDVPVPTRHDSLC
ncbi:hypothetical protein NPIL_134701 [Nephila pilipes]|uniref:Uncharacterized protein n=1 Tax=Nephila pilipes TaxID=299642 RepID=A0A8X6QDX0_NEPPI|nr:hypothetical protein NPIL_134701 [Nephila pilipes]